jgi:hypothetical protein
MGVCATKIMYLGEKRLSALPFHLELIGVCLELPLLVT